MTLSDKEYLQINQALFSLAHAYASRMAREETRSTMGLRLSDCSVLMVLGQCVPCNSRQLSKLMDVNPGTVSVYVQRLIELGLVRKEQDPEDRRNWWLILTEPGKGALQGVVDGAVEYTRSFLSKLNQTEQRSLHRLLLKASHSLGFDWQ